MKDSLELADLEVAVRVGGEGSIRNLAAAEAAVLRGQFNLAKVFRAVAHAQRVQALEAARLLLQATGSAQAPGPILDTLAAAREASAARTEPVRARGSSSSILDLGTWLANHDRGHLAQIRRIDSSPGHG